jgi:hypothetical protein
MAIDSKEKLIVDYSVVNIANDQNQLAPFAISAKETLDVDVLNITADAGFFNELQLKECVDNGITLYLPIAGGGKQKIPDPVNFGKEKFTYVKERDLYVCPTGRELIYRYETNMRGRDLRIYRSYSCKSCPFFLNASTVNKRGEDSREVGQ